MSPFPITTTATKEEEQEQQQQQQQQQQQTEVQKKVQSPFLLSRCPGSCLFFSLEEVEGTHK